jgi:hypothetical protein
LRESSATSSRKLPAGASMTDASIWVAPEPPQPQESTKPIATARFQDLRIRLANVRQFVLVQYSRARAGGPSAAPGRTRWAATWAGSPVIANINPAEDSCLV